MNSAPLTSTQSERLRSGIALFNRGEFFECHEVLEAVWLEVSGEDKLFLQGLIQVAVSFYHLRQGNFSGSSRLLRAGVEKLSTCAASQQPIDLPAMLQQLEPLPERIEKGQASPETPAPEILWRAAP